MADRNTRIVGKQIASAVAGDGLAKDGSDNFQVDFGTDKGLKFASNKLEVELKSSDSGLEISSGLGIAADGVSNTMLANMTQGTVKVGGASDAPTDLDASGDGYILIGDGTDINSVAVSGDVTITNAGVVTIGNDKVDNNKLANMTRGTVKVGGASDAPTDLDAKTDGYILIGDGTDLASVAVSGDVTITNAGVVTIGNDKVDNDKLANMTRGTVKVGGASDAPTDLDAKTDGYILIGDGTDVASVAVSGDITITNAGVTTIGSEKVTEAKIDIHNAPAVGKVLGYTANGLEWVDKETTDAVTEDDIVTEETPSGDINGVNTAYTLANSPVAGTVRVYLNGLRQEAGSGKDYTISGTSITFAVAPETGDILLADYFIA